MNRSGAWKIGRKIRISSRRASGRAGSSKFWRLVETLPTSAKTSSFAGPTETKTYSSVHDEVLVPAEDAPELVREDLVVVLSGMTEPRLETAEALLAADLEPLEDRDVLAAVGGDVSPLDVQGEVRVPRESEREVVRWCRAGA